MIYFCIQHIIFFRYILSNHPRCFRFWIYITSEALFILGANTLPMNCTPSKETAIGFLSISCCFFGVFSPDIFMLVSYPYPFVEPFPVTENKEEVVGNFRNTL